MTPEQDFEFEQTTKDVWDSIEELYKHAELCADSSAIIQIAHLRAVSAMVYLAQDKRIAELEAKLTDEYTLLGEAQVSDEHHVRQRDYLADQCSDLCIIYSEPVKYRIEPEYWVAKSIEETRHE